VTGARIAGVVWASFVCAGCVPALPQGEAPEANTEVPESYQGAPDDRTTALVDWRFFFRDPHLEGLIEEALRSNQELNLAVQESFLARFEAGARRGEILPRVGVGVGAGVERVGGTTSQGQSDEMAGLDENLQSYSFGLLVSWEIDIWNRLRNLADAAVNRYLATVEGRRFMVTRLVAEIASLYYELMALDQQLAVVEHTVELQERALDAVRAQWEAARTTSLAVNRFEAELLEFQSRRFELRQRVVETENRINFLVGRFPRPVERSSDQLMQMEPRTVYAGVPSHLLLNRPDVRAAELELAAAQLDVEAARARYFPALSIEAGVGYGATDILRLVETPGSVFFELFGNLTAPLLNRASITAGYFGADARRRQAVIHYERAILTAYIEVVNGLSRVENLAASYELTERRVQRLSESIAISNRLFNSAHADYLEVLTARRDSLNAQLGLIETKQRQMTAAVRLYQALGGGWRRVEPTGASAGSQSEDEQ